jgi:hypothetical protein
VADQDIVLRDPGGGVGAIAFDDSLPPVTGDGDAELPTLAAAAVGTLSYTGSASVALPALAAAGAGALAYSGAASAALAAPEATAAGALTYTGSASIALPAIAAASSGLLSYTGAGAAVLPALSAAGSGALAFVGTGAASLPALGAAAAGTLLVVITGVGAAALPALAAAATGTLIPPSGGEEPGFITLPRAGTLYELALPAVASLYVITLARPMFRLHIGDTAVLTGVTIRDAAGDLVDPATLTILILSPLGVEVELVYGTAPTSGSGDAVIRTAEGTFTVQIEITDERGAGVYRYTVVTTGARAAETGTFTVYARAV